MTKTRYKASLFERRRSLVMGVYDFITHSLTFLPAATRSNYNRPQLPICQPPWDSEDARE